MTASTSATPLMALDAVVIDTETTGLDPAYARLLEIGAVRLRAGRIDESNVYRSLIQPGEPIPPAATAIHGIDAARVQDAPGFAKAWEEFRHFADRSVIIGHAVGFDLAILKRECERAGFGFVPPRTLDTRLLAQIVKPDLAGYTIEIISAWLGVAASDRHTALGDAMTTARMFQALVPKLRESGIRTLAEAMAACRGLTGELDKQHRAGWVEALEAPGRLDRDALKSIDTYPYRHRVRDVMHGPAEFIAADARLSVAISTMILRRISSLYIGTQTTIGDKHHRAAQTGIVTERDILRALADHGANALTMPVSRFMSLPLAVVPADAFVYLAIGRMSRLKIRHLGVTDESGAIIGALSGRDLLRLRASEAISLGDEIDQARDVHDLGAAWAKLPQVAAALLSEDVSAQNVAAVISRRLGALTRQVAFVAELRMRKEGRGEPPCPYALAVLGSAGRGESLLAMDQDNALIFADGEPGGAADQWFERLGIHVADILDEVGVPYCKGGVMAKNPQWRGSLATWRERIAGWIAHSQPADLLAVDIFFDLRGVHGDGALADTLWREAFDAARGQVGFAKALVEATGGSQNGLGLFGRIKTEQGRIDLKKHGLFGIVTAARALAICHHVVERATPARLIGAQGDGAGRRPRSRSADRSAGDVPAFHPGAADRGYRAGPAAEQCRGWSSRCRCAIASGCARRWRRSRRSTI